MVTVIFLWITVVEYCTVVDLLTDIYQNINKKHTSDGIHLYNLFLQKLDGFLSMWLIYYTLFLLSDMLLSCFVAFAEMFLLCCMSLFQLEKLWLINNEQNNFPALRCWVVSFLNQSHKNILLVIAVQK